MIRLIDALTLAHTKLRVHRIRTGVAIAVSALLFGLIATVIIIMQGVFTSVDSFSDEGLNSRTVLNITKTASGLGFNEYDNAKNPAFIAEVEAAHAELVAKKKAAAAKYGIVYQPEFEDPSPIGIDPDTKQKVIKESSLGDTVVVDAGNKRRAAAFKPFDIKAYLKDYPSASVIQEQTVVTPESGQLMYMKDGKEKLNADLSNRFGAMYDDSTASLTLLDGSLSKPFVSNKNFDPTKGEIPVIVPYNSAEKLLKLPALPADASMQQKYDRLVEVRQKIGEVTAQFCYRNAAAQSLLAQAIAQQADIKSNESNKEYIKPKVIYEVPSDKTCGPVTIANDMRTVQEKAQADRQEQYEKEVGTYIGEPFQKLVTVRGVGISSALDTAGQWSVSELTKSLFASWLGYGDQWSIPQDLFDKLPAEARPDAIFGESTDKGKNGRSFFGYEAFLVEFSNKDEARDVLKKTQSQSSSDAMIFATPFGSGILFVDELQGWFETALLWMFAVVGSIAVIILASIIGRTVSEGRRESAIFRAIGASRLDIGAVYGMYVVLLALRVILFTAVLSIAIALVVEVLFWRDATLGARLSYAASDVSREFHLFSLTSPYLLWIIGVIIVVSVLAAIVPILLGARRNPIKDMRDDS